MISFALRQGFEREDQSVITTQGHELEGVTPAQTCCDGVSCIRHSAYLKLAVKRLTFAFSYC
jgi:hypothetical protein